MTICNIMLNNLSMFSTASMMLLLEMIIHQNNISKEMLKSKRKFIFVYEFAISRTSFILKMEES